MRDEKDDSDASAGSLSNRREILLGLVLCNEWFQALLTGEDVDAANAGARKSSM